MARDKQPRWPGGTPVAPGGKGPGGGRWREDGKPDKPRASWAEVAGRLIGRGRGQRRRDEQVQRDDAARQARIRRRHGLPDDATPDEIGLRIRQASTTQTHMRSGESAEEYGRRLGAAVAASSYWNPPGGDSPLDNPVMRMADGSTPAGDYGTSGDGDWATRMAARARGGGDAPRATTIGDVRDAVGTAHGGTQGQIDEQFDRRFGGLSVSELARLRGELSQAGDRQLYDRTGVRALDRMLSRRGAQRSDRGEVQLGSMRAQLDDLRQRGTGQAASLLADDLRHLSRADLEDMQDLLREQHANEARLGDSILMAAIEQAIRNLGRR